MNNLKRFAKKEEGSTMVILLVIMLVMGIMITFFKDASFVAQNLERIGYVIMLICIGLGVRITFFRKKGEKEKYREEIEKLEKQVAELQSSGKEAGK